MVGFLWLVALGRGAERHGLHAAAQSRRAGARVAARVLFLRARNSRANANEIGGDYGVWLLHRLGHEHRSQRTPLRKRVGDVVRIGAPRVEQGQHFSTRAALTRVAEYVQVSGGKVLLGVMLSIIFAHHQVECL